MKSAKKSAASTNKSPTSKVGDRAPAFVLPPTTSHQALLSAGSDKHLRELIYLMGQSFGRLLTCREAFGRSIGLTPPQYSVLIGTSYMQGTTGVTIRRLAEFVAFARPHVTTEVGHLIRKKFLIKRPNENDGRSVLVSLSPHGEAMLLDLLPYLIRVNDLLFEGVSQSDFKVIVSFFRKFSANGEFAMAEISRTEAEQHLNLQPRK